MALHTGGLNPEDRLLKLMKISVRPKFLKQRQLYLVTSEGVAKQDLYVSPDWHIHKARRARVGSTGSMVAHSPQVEQGFGRHTRRVARAQRMTQNDSLKKCRQMIGLFVFQLSTFIITNLPSFAYECQVRKDRR